LNIGILALQGDFEMHARMIKKLGHTPVFVRYAHELNSCDKLIIPGGESTTMLKLIEKNSLRSDLLDFGRSRAVMGTCAGLIVLSREAGDLPHPSLNLIDLEVTRNAYGRQIDSFVDTIVFEADGQQMEVEGVFIRAPKISKLGPDVQPLAYHEREVVMAANDHILAATFHPELTDDVRIHEYFINKIG